MILYMYIYLYGPSTEPSQYTKHIGGASTTANMGTGGEEGGGWFYLPCLLVAPTVLSPSFYLLCVDLNPIMPKRSFCTSI